MSNIVIGKYPISVFLHVQNEEKHIATALESVAWADEIFVVDGGSNDKTCEIARKYTDKLYFSEYRNSAQQKNWCLRNLPFKNEWVFHLDADEECTTELADEIKLAIAIEEYAGYYIPYHEYVLGHLIKHCWKMHNIRLYQHRKAKYDVRVVHSELILEGKAGYLKGYINHYGRSTISAMVDKINRQSTMEAEEAYLHGGHMMNESQVPRTLTKRILRQIWKVIPLKPTFLFIYMYVFRFGFLDGYIGLLICYFQSIYIFLSYAKLKEMKSNNS